MAKVVVYGATGNIGQRILAEALVRGHDVVAAVRNPAKVTEHSDRLTVVDTDPTDPAAVTGTVRGADAVIASLNGDPDFFDTSSRALVDGLRALGATAPRLLWVGGASSLLLPDGTRLVDSGRIPAAWLPLVQGQIDVLEYFRTVEDVRWTYLSPAEVIEAGGRQPGGFRIGADELVTDAAGTSRITYDDFAAALLDEVDTAAHVNRRFTAGY